MSDKELIEKIEDAYRRVRKIGPDAIYETELREVLRAAADALESVRSERDAALAAIERVKETLSLHNPNGRLVKEVLAALDVAPEPEEVEWEYGVRNRLTWKVGFPYSREEVADRIDDENRRVAGTYYVMRFEAVRRRKAGPWEPVGGEN